MAFFKILTVLIVLLLAVGTASGRQTSLYGSLSLLQEYDSNTNLSRTNEGNGWYTVVSPSIILTSKAQDDSLSFGYAPGLRYDQNNDHATNVDHYLTLKGSKQFSRSFSADLMENYIRSNDYTYFIEEYVQQPGAGIPLSAQQVRNEYWINGVGVSTRYEYAKGSVFRLGYANQILENDRPGLDDYVKHHPYLSLSYQFSQKWGTELSYDYLRGDFKFSEDLSEHLAGARLNYQWTRHDLVFGSYQYATLDYAGNRSGYHLHRSDLGWQRQLGPHSTMEASAGLSYADQEQGDSNTAFNYSVDYRRRIIERGEIRVGGKGGMDELQFDAISNEGLSRFWSVRGDVNYRLLEPFSSSAYVSYREDTFFQATPEYTDKSLVVGTSLTYAFWRWYAVSAGYSFRRLDSDLPQSSYNDHRFYVQMSVGKELKRWL